MKIGGLQSCTLSDFPGKVAAVVFFQGCNFRCPYCHNRQLIPLDAPPDKLIPKESVLASLQRRIGLLDGVVLCGGEPTLQPELSEFTAELRRMGFEIKLDTNGSCPAIVEKMLSDSLLDYIAMDIKAPWSRYARLAGTEAQLDDLRTSIRLLTESGVPHEFRTTFVPHLLTQQDLEAVRALLPPGATHCVNPYREPLVQ